MFSQLLRFEAFYQVKQRAFMIFAFIFLFYGLVTGGQGFAPANVNFNSSYQINFYTGLISLGCVFIIMFLAISAVLRDKRFQMESLVFSTSIKKAQFFWSRFVGLFLFSLISFTPFLFGYATMVTFSNLDPERVAVFDLMSYIQPFLLIVVPNVFFCSAVIFTVTILTKSNIATYVSAFFIYMLYMLSSMYLNSPMMAQSVPASPEAMALAALADPFGLAAFFEQTQYWTAFQKNTQLLSFSGLYMWNRLLWTGVSLVILFGAYSIFSFRTLSKKAKKKEAKDQTEKSDVVYNPVAVEVGGNTQRKAFFTLLKLEWHAVFKSLPFLVVNVIWVVIVFLECFARIHNGGAYHDSWYPMTNLLIELFADPLMLFGLILIVFYSGELVWRARSFNFSGIIDATPVANWAFFLSKFIVLVSLPMMLILSSIVLSLGFQLSLGYLNFEIGQYLAMFYFNGMQFLIFCLVALFVQSVMRNKFLGMGVTIIVILFCFLAPKIGVEHLMLRPGKLSIPGYTNMTGYSAEILPFAHFSIYWVAFTGMLTLLAFKLWERGENTGIKSQIKALRTRWKKWELITWVAFGVLFISMGSVIWYNMHIMNEYQTAEDFLDYRESYERKFKKYESFPRLYHTEMKTEVDLFPKENKYRVKANYVMINREEEAITQLFISEREPLSKVVLGNAKLVAHDADFGTYLFEFEQPIQPQQEVKFSFEINRFFDGYEISKELVENGTYLMQRSFEPILTYRSSMEISDNFERAKRGLPHRKLENTTDIHLAQEDYKVSKVKYETTLSTAGDEVAIGTGELVSQWSKGGRNYYHYKAREMVMPMVGYFSSAYQVRKEKIGEISFEQYYYPAHDFNIDSVSRSVRQTLDYCSANFGDYPYSYLRIAEVPGHWQMGGFAHPGVISMVEDNLYLIDIRNPNDFNLVAKRTIHEVAHQWWGHQLAPKIAAGGTLFIEGFAKYTEAVLMERLYGKKAVLQLSETARKRYFQGRAYASEKEPPLYLLDGQSYMAYGKNYTVMLALHELLGEEQVNSVLKQLVETYGNQRQFELTSLIFLDELYQVATEDQKVLIDDWFKRVITYDLSVEEAEIEVLENGQYEVTIQLQTKRFETNAEGEEESIDINEPIQIGLFSQHPSVIKNERDILYLESSTFNQEKSTVTIVLDEKPVYVAIDPYGTRVEEGFVDNLVRL